MQCTIHRSTASSRRAFTLLELLVAITILAMLAALSLGMLRNVAEYARVDRTKVMIQKLDTFMSERYNSYLTRTVPIRPPATYTPQQTAQMRLGAIRELMRLELPDRQGDLDYDPANSNVTTIRLRVLTTVPSITRAMRSKLLALETTSALSGPAKKWSAPNEGAECLYLIASTMQSNGKNVLDGFSASEIGDTDEDGVPEILDAWGQPIHFVRWPAGFLSDVPLRAGVDTAVTPQVQDPANNSAPDPFDPLKVDSRWGTASASTFKPFALKPLIFSGGQDREIGLVTFDYDPGAPSTIVPYFQYDYYSDPYIELPTCKRYLAEPFQSGQGYQDNITNHYVETP